MNAVEIEEAISALVEEPFDQAGFPYAFLEAFGNKKATLDKLKKGDANKSDIERGVLQRNNIHLAICSKGNVSETLIALRKSPASTKHKVKFLLATDGYELEAEELNSGDMIACEYDDFPNKFAFFLPLAGITAIKQIRENSFDIRATSRLNRLYVQLLKDNKDWTTEERRSDMNHFLARLIFCFFAEDTDIFSGENLFTETVNKMSESNSSNTHEIIGELFRAMNTPDKERQKMDIRSWANDFPYVNGGLFAGETDVPIFSRIARSYLIHIGTLDWRQINPDIFGSMIQAVAEDEERGELGMHYTSVPNILKVLNPLFLDDLNEQLVVAGDSPQKLLNLRKRIAKIRIFDPACGSGNFLVIAYKEMRAIELEINKRRHESENRTVIPLTNFRGIELRNFSAEVARLALIIAEYQCNFLYRGQKEALKEFLPLDSENWITCGNALRLDWISICPPTETSVKLRSDDLFETLIDQAQIDFENEGGETYICGNPPYLGSTWQSTKQKEDLKNIFDGRTKSWKSLDYVAGWFIKAADYGLHTSTVSAFVSTNSICQGQIVPILWPLIFNAGYEILFAHTSFKWSNLASHNAGVVVAIVGISNVLKGTKKLYSNSDSGETILKEVENINAYLTSAPNIIIQKSSKPLTQIADMSFGNKPVDGGNLLLNSSEVDDLGLSKLQKDKFIRRIYGSSEFIRGEVRYCLWIEDKNLEEALQFPEIKSRIDKVRKLRLASSDSGANEMAVRSHQMREINIGFSHTIVVPSVSSENRKYLPVGLIDGNSTVTNASFAIYDAPIWNLAILLSHLHLVWISTVCGKLTTRYRYSNTLGWNTFPIPKLTEKNKYDLTAAVKDIILARETHFPKTLAELYSPALMPDNLRVAHERNDEVLERIYIGRRFKNDTERLAKLFELYIKMTAGDGLTNNRKKVS